MLVLENSMFTRFSFANQHAFTFCLLVGLLLPVSASAYNSTQTQNITTTGQKFTFTFSNIPRATSLIRVRVDILGRYRSRSQYATVQSIGSRLIGGSLGRLSGNTFQTCNTSLTSQNRRYFYIHNSESYRGSLIVIVQNSGSVTPYCQTQYVRVNVSYSDNVSALPDIALTAASTASGSTTAANQTFTTKYTIYNRYQNLTTDFFAYFYYCPTQGTTGCVYLNRQAITTDMGINKSYNFTSPTLRLPVTVEYGTSRYIRIWIDAQEKINEGYEGNNNRYYKISITARPDLSIVASTVPKTGSTSAPLSIFSGEYTIRNNAHGSRITQSYKVNYWYCSSSPRIRPPSGPSSCIHLGEQTLTADLNSGASYTFTSRNLTLPSSARRGTRYILAWVDYNRTVTERSDNNNTDIDPITVASDRPLPDLTAFGASKASGSMLKHNDAFTVKYSIRNNNLGFSTDFYVYFYHCYGSRKEGCKYLGKQLITTNMSANKSYTYTSPTLRLPGSVIRNSSNYIRFTVDALKKVTESDETNNNYDFRFSINNTYPDLQIISSTVPSSGSTDGPLFQYTATYVIRNNPGGVRINQVLFLYFWYCNTKPTIKPPAAPSGCASMGYKKFGITLDSGESKTYSFDFKMPSSVQTGTRYIVAWADYIRRISERDNNNNTDIDDIKVTTTKTAPDLELSSAKLSKTTVQGAGEQIAVAYSVRNNGGVDTPAFKIAFYYASRSAANLLGVVSEAALKAGTTRSNRVHTILIPKSVSFGSQNILWTVDYTNVVKNESNKSNNNGGLRLQITGKPNLQVSLLTINPGTGPIGTTLKVSYRVYNAGSSRAKGFRVGLFYSTDTKITLGDTDLKVDKAFGGLDAKTTVQMSLTIKIPSTATIGKRYIGAWADYNSKVPYESNPADNIRTTPFTVVAPKLIDLKISKLTITPAKSTVGKELTANITITNTGNTDATPFTVQLYYSTDSNITTSDTKLHRFLISGVKAGTSTSSQPKFTFSPSPAPKAGKGYIGAIVDDANVIKETNEKNQTASTAFQVQVDNDKDGHASDVDCNDNDKTIYPKAPELCDGKDNDCNKKVDDVQPKSCTNSCGNQGTQACVKGKWSTCQAASCEAGSEGGASDAGMNDASGQEKTDCYTDGCPSGQICNKGQCIKDPCQGHSCGADEFCRDGGCVKACGCTKCAKGEKCVDGFCQNDPCANASCKSGEICNPNSGKCDVDKCANVTCGKGRVCEDGKCIDDTCAHINCPTDTKCKAGQCIGKTCATEEPSEPSTEPTEEDQEVTPEEAQSSEESNTEQADAATAEATGDAGEAITEESTNDGGTAEPTEKTTEVEAPSGCCAITPTNRGPLSLLFSLFLFLLPLIHFGSTRTNRQ